MEKFDHDQPPKLANRTKRAVFAGGIGAVVRIGWRGGLANRQQSAAELQLLSAEAVGQKAEPADADQTGRQDVQQKAAHELDRIQGHDLALAVLRVVLPFKTDAAVFQSAKAMVGDGYAMGVARQILEHALRSAERRLDVHHPFDIGGLLAQGLECSGRSQRAELAGETQGTAAEGLAQLRQELLAEALAEQAIGKKEAVCGAGDPARAIGRDSKPASTFPPSRSYSATPTWRPRRAKCREARERAGLSIKDVARRLSVPQYRIRAVESVEIRNMAPTVLRNYLDHLGLSDWYSEWAHANPELAYRLESGNAKEGHHPAAPDTQPIPTPIPGII